MTELRGIVRLDISDVTNRTVEIEWKTDKKILDQALTAPLIWNKIFPVGTIDQDVIDAFKSDNFPIIQAMEIQLNTSLVGVTIIEVVP